MTRLHIFLVNIPYLWRDLCNATYRICHAPLNLGDRDPDVIWWRQQVAIKRVEEAAGVQWIDGVKRDGQGRFASHEVQVTT